ATKSPSTRSPKNSSRSLSAWPVLECVSARVKSPGSRNSWPSASLRSLSGCLFDRLKEPIVADGPWPLPKFPNVGLASLLIVGDRGDDDELRFADEVLLRNIADAGVEITAVGGIVAVVAHHEIVACRHDVFLRVVETTLRIAVENVVRHAARQRLAEA